MKEEKQYLTQEKFDELKSELDYLMKEKRKEVAENLEYAKSLGDLSENAEYHEAREMQANIEDRINKLEAILKSAAIVSGHETETVSIGSTIVVQKENSKETQKYILVGSEEADMSQNKLSIKSPFGQAALGKRKGEIFSFATPAGKASYKLIGIE